MDWADVYARLVRDRNDPHAWAALQRAVRPWARAALGAAWPHQVEDVVAETCASVVLSLDRARSPHTFGGFAYGCFLNERRRHRRGRRDWQVSLDSIDIAAPTAEELGSPYADLLAAAVAGLPARERRAVLLRYVDEQSPAAIARHLGVSPVNARQIVHKGLRRLRQSLVQRSG
jgi:RNA polymerase sigma factor (sigma-70 family)